MPNRESPSTLVVVSVIGGSGEDPAARAIGLARRHRWPIEEAHICRMGIIDAANLTLRIPLDDYELLRLVVFSQLMDLDPRIVPTAPMRDLAPVPDADGPGTNPCAGGEANDQAWNPAQVLGASTSTTIHARST